MLLVFPILLLQECLRILAALVAYPSNQAYADIKCSYSDAWCYSQKDYIPGVRYAQILGSSSQVSFHGTRVVTVEFDLLFLVISFPVLIGSKHSAIAPSIFG